MATGKQLLWIFLFSLFPLVIVLLFGYGGNDVYFHYSSWMGYSEAFANGNLTPAWDGNANYDLGSPRFYFYPPLSLMLGGLLGVVLPDQLIGLVFFWLCLFLSGMTMYLCSGLFLARRHDRCLAAILYLTCYYTLYGIFTRFAAAEAFANSLLPLTFYLFARTMLAPSRGRFTGLALMLLVTWLTDIPIAVASAYLLGGVAVVSAVIKRWFRPLVLYCLAQFAAITMAMGYLLPARMALDNIASVERLIFAYTPNLYNTVDYLTSMTPDAMIYSLLWAYTVLGLGIFIGFLKRLRKLVRYNDYWKLAVALAGMFFILQSPGTEWLWNIIPLFKVIGFNFRFQVFWSLVLALMVVVAFRGWQRRAIYVVWGMFFLATLAGNAVISHKAESRGEAYGVYHSAGLQTLLARHPGTDEYQPRELSQWLTSSNSRDVEQFSDSIAPVATDSSACRADLNSRQSAYQKLTVTTPTTCRVTLHQFYFPFWKVRVDGRPVEAQRSDQGLLSFGVDSGSHTVEVRFVTPGINRWIGLSGLLVGMLLLWAGQRLILASLLAEGRKCAAHAMKAKSP